MITITHVNLIIFIKIFHFKFKICISVFLIFGDHFERLAKLFLDL